jgi:hypothetical protein
MNGANALAYVRAAAVGQGLVLDEPHALAVAGHLAVAAGMAALLDAAGLGCEDEPAQIYSPAPFPDAEPGAPTP